MLSLSGKKSYTGQLSGVISSKGTLNGKISGNSGLEGKVSVSVKNVPYYETSNESGGLTVYIGKEV